MSRRSVGGFEVPKSEGGTARAQIAERQERDAGQNSWSGGWHSPGGGSPQGRGGCFPAGTSIATPAGPQDISSLSAGETVYAIDARTGVRAERPILRVVRHAGRRTWRLTLDDGRFVRTTAVHTFRVGTSWRRADAIGPGDVLAWCADGGGVRAATVAASGADGGVEDVYTLVVDGECTFVANGFVAHCFTRFRTVRTAAWRAVGFGRRLAGQPSAALAR